MRNPPISTCFSSGDLKGAGATNKEHRASAAAEMVRRQNATGKFHHPMTPRCIEKERKEK